MSGEGQNLELDDYIVKKYEVKKRIGKGVSHTPVVNYSDSFFDLNSVSNHLYNFKKSRFSRKSVGSIF